VGGHFRQRYVCKPSRTVHCIRVNGRVMVHAHVSKHPVLGPYRKSYDLFGLFCPSRGNWSRFRPFNHVSYLVLHSSPTVAAALSMRTVFIVFLGWRSNEFTISSMQALRNCSCNEQSRIIASEKKTIFLSN
jgi:hypothetical protein